MVQAHNERSTEWKERSIIKYKQAEGKECEIAIPQNQMRKEQQGIFYSIESKERKSKRCRNVNLSSVL